MGLDVSIGALDANGISCFDENDTRFDYFVKNSLSQTFCNLLSRSDVIDGEPELKQIGRIASVDITPLNDMLFWYPPEYADELCRRANSAKEKAEILAHIQQCNDRVRGNIDRVHAAIDLLLQRLPQFRSLPDMLNDNGYDTLGNAIYFSNFTEDKGDGYIGNNFGHDLRNFDNFLVHVKNKGAKTVYFNFG
jgi:hypothetical protein